MTPAYTEGAGIVEVVRRHAAPLVRFARRFVGSLDDAEDIVQEALARAYEDRLRRSRQAKELANSVYKIAHNLSVDHLRRRRLRLVEEATLERRPSYQPTPEEEFELDALREAVRQAVAELPEAYREAVALRFGLGLSYRECARQLHIGVSAVESRLHRAKKKLRHALRPWTGRHRSRPQVSAR